MPDSNCGLVDCQSNAAEKSNYCIKHQKLSIRSQVRAPKGKLLLQVDLSQAEAWVVAFLAGEERMKKALQFGDIHCLTAAILGLAEQPWEFFLTNPGKQYVSEDKRYLSKRINHGSNYGMGPFRQTEVINKDSDKPPYITVTNKQTKEYQAKWLAFYNIRNYWLEIDDKLRNNHFLITPYGRKRTFYGPNSHEQSKEGYAYIPQSTVADHCFGKVQKELGIEGGLFQVLEQICSPSKGEIKLINSSHDSGILELPVESVASVAPQVKKLMQRPIIIAGEECLIPADIEVGERWGEMEKLKVA